MMAGGNHNVSNCYVMEFSYHKISEYLKCPVRYYYEYVVGLKPRREDTIETLMGKKVENVIVRTLEGISDRIHINGETKIEKIVEEVVREVCDEFRRKNDEIMPYYVDEITSKVKEDFKAIFGQTLLPLEKNIGEIKSEFKEEVSVFVPGGGEKFNVILKPDIVVFPAGVMYEVKLTKSGIKVVSHSIVRKSKTEMRRELRGKNFQLLFYLVFWNKYVANGGNGNKLIKKACYIFFYGKNKSINVENFIWTYYDPSNRHQQNFFNDFENLMIEIMQEIKEFHWGSCDKGVSVALEGTHFKPGVAPSKWDCNRCPYNGFCSFRVDGKGLTTLEGMPR